MIDKASYSLNHILEVASGTKADKQILERSIYALGLLEALARVNTPMRFKGGSSLMLLLDAPARLSTDIDIVVPPETEIEGYIEVAVNCHP